MAIGVIEPVLNTGDQLLVFVLVNLIEGLFDAIGERPNPLGGSGQLVSDPFPFGVQTPLTKSVSDIVCHC